MSGPIVPPLEVSDEADGGSVSGRPITTIEVTDGTLTVSGRTATIDTSGSGGTPGGSNTEVQFNNSGAFGGDSGFTYNRSTNVATVTGGVVLADLNIGDSAPTAIRATTLDDDLYFAPEGSGTLTLQNHDSAGGTLADAKFIMMRNANTDEAVFQFQDATTSHQVTLTQVSGSDFQIQNREDNKDLDLIVGGTGIVEIQNSTADQTGTLSIRGNGTGDANLQFSNPTKSVSLLMETNNKITVTSGSNDFVLDVSSATGGITWPDGTTQITAASGGGAPEVGYFTGYYYAPMFNGAWGAATTTMVADKIYAVPIRINKEVDIDRMVFFINVADLGSNLRIGIYNADTSTGMLGTNIVSGTASSASTGAKEITISETLAAGNYWACAQSDGTPGISYYNDGASQQNWAVASSSSAATNYSASRYRFDVAYSSGMTDLTSVEADAVENYAPTFNMRIA